MIPVRLTIALIIALAVFFIMVLLLLKHRRLDLKYTLLWFLTGIIMFILVIWPELTQKLASMFGIQSNMNGLYSFLIAFIFIILMSLTSICSGQNARIRELVQMTAIYERRLREVEKKIEELM